jgi:anaerobic magnesium-protoporphyrin IX monomethyl ester cyclase
MRILFINTINVSRLANDEFFHPALSTLYLASYLQKYGGYNNFKVIQTSNIDENILSSYKPDLIGVTAVTQNFGIAKDICHQIKSLLDVPVIIGGVHISTLPSCLTKDMDIGVIGEGEETILELVQAYESGNLVKESVKGIIYRENDQLKQTPRRDLIQPLDKIPFPARNLVNIHPFMEHALLTSRGCPYSCSFCSPYAMWHSMRFFSPEYVVAEIDEVYTKYKCHFVGIADDLFTVNKKRLREIAVLSKKANFHGNLRLVCSGRANLIDDETVKLCKEIGISIIQMGLESGNQHTLDYLKCKSVTVEDNKRAIDIISDNGLEAVASFIIGTPTETREEMMQTLNFIKKSRLSYFQINTLIPFPGTQAWEEAKAMGAVKDEMDWSKFAYGLDENPKERVIMSRISRTELLEVLAMFNTERRRRMRNRTIKFAILHPERIYNHLKLRRQFAKFKQELKNE